MPVALGAKSTPLIALKILLRNKDILPSSLFQVPYLVLE